MSVCPPLHAMCVAWLDMSELLWLRVLEHRANTWLSEWWLYPLFPIFFLLNPREAGVRVYLGLGLWD